MPTSKDYCRGHPVNDFRHSQRVFSEAKVTWNGKEHDRNLKDAWVWAFNLSSNCPSGVMRII